MIIHISVKFQTAYNRALSKSKRGKDHRKERDGELGKEREGERERK